ncbi:hypothetical protein [Sorangium sp. So ce513]|uniref:hypothetical protein n=1 Tax=Sorangium sp. So ce513 TaxID=3133315 RepID=UPI003F61A178
MRGQALIALAALGLLGAACSSDPGFEGAKAPKIQAARNPDGTIDDRSMCEWKGREDREVSETAGPGAIQPNVRRVWQIIGTGEDRHRALVCREIDTNFDGVKDVVRRYNDKGESLHEESDSNYDGRIDTWLTFAGGRLAEVRLDTDRDGNPDEWKYYSGGKLVRIKRDTNRDGKPDVWEIYRMGRLERMGVDIDGDERVDRWDHDNELRRRLEDDERRKDEEAAAAAAKKSAEEQGAADAANEAVDGGGNAEPPGNKD